MQKRSDISCLHGGDWAGYCERYGREPLDFSINISPSGIPDEVKEALIAAVSEVDRYPDPFCRELRKKLAKTEQVLPEQILCGNGAADLIGRIVQAVRPDRGLVTAPSFSEYRQAMEQFEVPCERIVLDADHEFRLPEDFPDRIPEDVQLVFLCQPNNPTGVTTYRELLLRILKRCKSIGAVLVMDECFTDLLDDPEVCTMKPYLSEYPNLIILKAFTKTYAIPGVRLGYCMCADEELLGGIAGCGQAWEVSHLAQRAGIAALDADGYLSRTRDLISRNRPLLKAGLEELGMRVIPGEANFLLFSGPEDLDVKLMEEGILIRSCANYEGLPQDRFWYRTAVRTEEENRILLAGIAHCIGRE